MMIESLVNYYILVKLKLLNVILILDVRWQEVPS